MCIRDSRYTLLHIACLNNKIDIVHFLIDQVKSSSENVLEAQRVLNIWVNQKNKEGYTPLHYAAYRGNIELVKLLESYGADIEDKNENGLNVIHIASQGDQPVSLAYFRERGFDLNVIDNKGSTALHWAAFLGCENSTNFLTSWKCNPNVKDLNGGCSPLHLAVISGNTRVVRRLLIKGANKHLRDKSGKLPVDIAQENNFTNIVSLLEDQNFFMECSNIRPTAKHRVPQRTSLFFLIFLVLLNHTINVLFVFPFVRKEEVLWIISYGVIAVLVIVFFLGTWLRDPGFLKKKKNLSILQILLKYECYNVCPECEIVKPPRSRHCELCNQCVQVFDHHCPWVNNCVGARNHGFFLSFIISIFFEIVHHLIFYTSMLERERTAGEFFPQLIADEWLYRDVAIGCLAIVGILFILPLGILVYVQLMNFFKNKTTTERYGRTASTVNNPGTDDENPRASKDDVSMQRGSLLANCGAMCCRNAKNENYVNLVQLLYG
eukprot:TRINITY_DN6681_c0_g1_i3.p1 TRINITY_DN6681_c0_g1~~TRINITY_DN6681_c0_g1_i3.p1  ORF type:complete len:526 (+),score=75.36 TRINITY_DN6681_c0_g1_i3:104-1579(+)